MALVMDFKRPNTDGEQSGTRSRTEPEPGAVQPASCLNSFQIAAGDIVPRKWTEEHSQS